MDFYFVIIKACTVYLFMFILGFWPDDPHQFGLISFHSCGHLLGRPPSFGDEELSQTVRAQAVLAGYAWLLAQANYQGINFQDISSLANIRGLI